MTRTTPERVVQLPATLPADEGDTRWWVFAWLNALLRLVVSLLPEYLGIVLLLGATRAWLFPALALTHGAGPLLLLTIVGLAIAGTLFVIPTAGEIPVIQTLMLFGLGAGPAGVLLMTLPAISLPSLVMVARVFPLRVLGALLGMVALMGVVAGLLAMALGLHV